METKTLTYEIDIAAPVEKVWHTMLQKETYEVWTTIFSPGSTYEGSWDEGSEIRFLDPEGNGMFARIAANRPYEFVSIEHLGMIGGSAADSDSAKDWESVHENYTFSATDDGTHVRVDIDMLPEYVEMFNDTWPRALQKLKEICEE